MIEAFAETLARVQNDAADDGVSVVPRAGGSREDLRPRGARSTRRARRVQSVADIHAACRDASRSRHRRRCTAARRRSTRPFVSRSPRPWILDVRGPLGPLVTSLGAAGGRYARGSSRSKTTCCASIRRGAAVFLFSLLPSRWGARPVFSRGSRRSLRGSSSCSCSSPRRRRRRSRSTYFQAGAVLRATSIRPTLPALLSFAGLVTFGYFHRRGADGCAFRGVSRDGAGGRRRRRTRRSSARAAACPPLACTRSLLLVMVGPVVLVLLMMTASRLAFGPLRRRAPRGHPPSIALMAAHLVAIAWCFGATALPQRPWSAAQNALGPVAILALSLYLLDCWRARGRPLHRRPGSRRSTTTRGRGPRRHRQFRARLRGARNDVARSRRGRLLELQHPRRLNRVSGRDQGSGISQRRRETIQPCLAF